jgi:hypothetical protein
MGTVTTTRAPRKPKARSCTLSRSGKTSLAVLTLTVGREVFHYFLSELPCQAGGRGFLLEKFASEQKPGEPDHYHVRVDAEAPSCECLGFLRWGMGKEGKGCKHIAATRELIAAGKL